MHFLNQAHPARARQALDPYTGGAVPRLPAGRTRRLCSRLAFHCVPKYASWLDMVGIEIGILGPMQSIGGPDHATVITEVDAGGPRRPQCRARTRPLAAWHRTGPHQTWACLPDGRHQRALRESIKSPAMRLLGRRAQTAPGIV